MQTSISNNEVQSRVQKLEHWTWQLNVKNFGDGSLTFIPVFLIQKKNTSTHHLNSSSKEKYFNPGHSLQITPLTIFGYFLPTTAAVISSGRPGQVRHYEITTPTLKLVEDHKKVLLPLCFISVQFCGQDSRESYFSFEVIAIK